MSVLEVRNLRKRFGATEVLEDINLTAEKGEFLVLVGPSGCGKSTLLNIIAGLEEASEGDILINDRVVNDLPPRDRDIAMVFQSYALYPTMTVARNITYGMRVRGVPAREREAALARVAAQLQIAHLLDRKPSQLSGGQRQRVAMGRALVREPEIFLFDEPLSNLDAKLRVEMRQEIKKLHQRLDATIIYVTHDQTEAMNLATTVAVLNNGHIVQVGPPQELYDRPMTVFVADFIGSPAMNFIAGKLEESQEGWRFAATENGREITLPIHHYDFSRPPRHGQPVLLGLRPEYISGGDEGGRVHRVSFEVKPVLIESNGFDQHMAFLFCGREISGRFSPRTALQLDEPVEVHFDLSMISLFDRETEKRL